MIEICLVPFCVMEIMLFTEMGIFANDEVTREIALTLLLEKQHFSNLIDFLECTGKAVSGTLRDSVQSFTSSIVKRQDQLCYFLTCLVFAVRSPVSLHILYHLYWILQL